MIQVMDLGSYKLVIITCLSGDHRFSSIGPPGYSSKFFWTCSRLFYEQSPKYSNNDIEFKSTIAILGMTSAI